MLMYIEVYFDKFELW